MHKLREGAKGKVVRTMGKKGKKDAGDPKELSKDEEFKRASVLNSTQQILLAKSNDEVARMQADVHRANNEADALRVTLQSEREATIAVTSDLSRQYKSMQNNLTQRIGELEDSLQKSADSNAMLKLQLEQQEGDHLKMQEEHKKEISELNQRIEDMTQDFSDMLKETLEKMSQKISAQTQSVDESGEESKP